MTGPSPLSPELLAGMDSLKQFADVNPAVMAELKARLGFVPPPVTSTPVTQVFDQPSQDGMPIPDFLRVSAPVQAPPPSAPIASMSDQIVASARDLPDLIRKASVLDPALAAKFTGQALIASRSPWGSLAGGAVAWAVSHWALGWDQATCDLVAGAGVLIASFAMRTLTEHPITGLFRAATPAQAAAAATTKGTTS